MKRFLVLVLITCLLSGFGVSAAESPVHGDEWGRGLDVLLGIGVMTSEDIRDGNEEISRSQAAHLVASLNGLGGIGSKVTESYTDVNAKTEYVSDITVLSDLGIIGGYSDGTFKPDNSISGGEVIKLILSAAGYSAVAQASGGYPAGYYSCAAKCGLLKGLTVSLTDPLTFADAVTLMYNALDVEIMTAESISSEGENLKTYDGQTVLTQMLGIQKEEGVVTSTPYAALTPAGKSARGEVIIDGKKFAEGESGAAQLFGCKAEYYFKENEAGLDVILFAATSDNVRIVEIEADNFEKYTGSEFVYFEGGKERSVSVSKVTDIVYNNAPAVGLNSSLKLSNGTIRLIDNDGSGAYDVCLIKEYRNVYAENIDYSNGIIYDKYNMANAVKFDPADVGESVIIYDRKGNEVPLRHIELDSLLSCLISIDGESIIIYEVVKEIIGVVNGIVRDGDCDFITIGDTEYRVAKELADSGAEWNLGDKLICYLDINGRLAALGDSKAGKHRWAILEKLRKGTGIEAEISMRVFEETAEEGKLTNFDFAPKVEIDDFLYKEAELTFDTLSEKFSGLRVPIKFALNADGEVSSIITERGNDFVCMSDYTSYMVDYNTQVLGGKIGYNDSTLVFSVPGNGLGEENYRVTPLTKQLGHNTSYTLKVYKEDDEALDADVILIQNTDNSAHITKYSPTMMVERVSETFDENGMPQIKVSGYEGLGYQSYLASDYSVLSQMKALGDASGSIYSVKEGDLIRFVLNSKNCIKAAQLVYRGEDNKIYSDNPSSSNYYESVRVLMGSVYMKDGVAFLVSAATDLNAVDPSSLDLYKVNDGSSVLLYDRKKDEITRGNASDLLDFKSFGINCSDVVLFATAGELDTLIVIK